MNSKDRQFSGRVNYAVKRGSQIFGNAGISAAALSALLKHRRAHRALMASRLVNDKNIPIGLNIFKMDRRLRRRSFGAIFNSIRAVCRGEGVDRDTVGLKQNYLAVVARGCFRK